METRTRRNLGDKTSGTNQRFAQQLIWDCINEAYMYYVGIMIDTGEGYFAMPAESFDIVANQYSYDLSSLLSYIPIKVKMVERIYSTEWIALQKWERNGGRFYDSGVGSGMWFPSYRFLGQNLTFNQKPDFNYTDGLRVEGYKVPALMVSGSESPDSQFHYMWHNMLVLNATVACIESKEATGLVGDPEMFRTRLAKQEMQFMEVMDQRTESRESVDPFVVSGEDVYY